MRKLATKALRKTNYPVRYVEKGTAHKIKRPKRQLTPVGKLVLGTAGFSYAAGRVDQYIWDKFWQKRRERKQRSSMFKN